MKSFHELSAYERGGFGKERVCSITCGAVPRQIEQTWKGGAPGGTAVDRLAKTLAALMWKFLFGVEYVSPCFRPRFQAFASSVGSVVV